MKKMYVLGTGQDPCECTNRFHAKNLVIWHTEDETTFGIRKEVYTKEAKTFFDGNIYVPDDFEIIELV